MRLALCAKHDRVRLRLLAVTLASAGHLLGVSILDTHNFYSLQELESLRLWQSRAASRSFSGLVYDGMEPRAAGMLGKHSAN